MKFLKMLLMTMVFALPLAACDMNDGDAEKFGEKVDNAASETKDAVEDTADDIGDSVEDACEEATDENC